MAHRCDTSPAAASTAAALKYNAVLDLRLWIVPPGKAALVPRRRAQMSTPEHAVPATAAYEAGRVWGRLPAGHASWVESVASRCRVGG